MDDWGVLAIFSLIIGVWAGIVYWVSEGRAELLVEYDKSKKYIPETSTFRQSLARRILKARAITLALIFAWPLVLVGWVLWKVILRPLVWLTQDIIENIKDAL